MPATAFTAKAAFAVVFGSEYHQPLLVEIKVYVFNEPLGRLRYGLVHTGLAVMDAAGSNANRKRIFEGKITLVAQHYTIAYKIFGVGSIKQALWIS